MKQSLLTLLLVLAHGASALSAWNFDWDDNIAFMPTKIVLFHKATHEELLMTTGDFARYRTLIGKSGSYQGHELADFEVSSSTERNSFRYFRDGTQGENYFLSDVRDMTEANNWQAPSWDAFVYALSQPETAAQTTIITARGHSREAILEGIRFLQARGYVKYLPRMENLYAVSHPAVAKEFGFEGADAADTSAVKAAVMRRLLDRLESTPLEGDEAPVLSRDGTRWTQSHSWGFSDDDFGNYDKAMKVLSQDIAQGKWAKVKVTLFFTGHHADHPVETKVLQDDGSARTQLPLEQSEGYVER